MSSPRLLLVEAEAEDAKLVLGALASGGGGVECVRVSSDEELRAALGAGGWNLVLTGIGAPPRDGLGTLEIVRKLAPDLPVIVISRTTGERVAVAAMRAGAQDFFGKADLSGLGPALARELRDARERAELRRADAALRLSESRFRSLVSSIDGLVAMLDLDARCTAVFGRWLGRVGFDEGRFIGRRPAEALGGDGASSHDDAIARGLAGESAVVEWPMADGEGSPRQLEMVLAPLRGDGDAVVGLVGVIQDKTEQKQALAQLLVADRMASVGTLASGVAHEINNPLAAVIANLDYVKMVLGEGTGTVMADVGDAVREAHEAADKVRMIVRDLRLFSGTGDEKIRGPVDLNRILDSAARMAWNEIRHRARLVKHYADLPAVDGNEPALGQVFLNLIMNAVQAIPAGHATANELTLTTTVDADGRIVAEVHDTGAGMTPAVQARLFTPFFTTRPVGIGTGLGLPICHRIVTSLGGTITVESQVDRGTTATVVLQAAFAAKTAATATRAVTARAKGVRARVLIVDDEAGVRSALRRTLGREHDVVDVETGALALARLRADEPYDVILCDLMMPTMTGMELFARIEAEQPEHASRIVFLTGGAFTPEAHAFLGSTPNTWLEKPYDSAALRRLIRERVARRRPVEHRTPRAPLERA